MVASRGGGRNAFDDDDYASSVAPFGKRGGSLPNDDGHNGDVDYHHRNGPGGAYANGSGSHQPSARAAASRSRATVAAAAAADEFDYDIDGQAYDEDVGSLEDPGDIQGDPDEKKYCYCNRISFGQMVGCDDENCEKEWVRPRYTTCVWFLTRLMADVMLFLSVPPYLHWTQGCTNRYMVL